MCFLFPEPKGTHPLDFGQPSGTQKPSKDRTANLRQGSWPRTNVRSGAAEVAIGHVPKLSFLFGGLDWCLEVNGWVGAPKPQAKVSLNPPQQNRHNKTHKSSIRS